MIAPYLVYSACPTWHQIVRAPTDNLRHFQLLFQALHACLHAWLLHAWLCICLLFCQSGTPSIHFVLSCYLSLKCPHSPPPHPTSQHKHVIVYTAVYKTVLAHLPDIQLDSQLDSLMTPGSPARPGPLLKRDRILSHHMRKAGAHDLEGGRGS